MSRQSTFRQLHPRLSLDSRSVRSDAKKVTQTHRGRRTHHTGGPKQRREERNTPGLQTKPLLWIKGLPQALEAAMRSNVTSYEKQPGLCHIEKISPTAIKMPKDLVKVVPPV